MVANAPSEYQTLINVNVATQLTALSFKIRREIVLKFGVQSFVSTFTVYILVKITKFANCLHYFIGTNKFNQNFFLEILFNGPFTQNNNDKEVTVTLTQTIKYPH